MSILSDHSRESTSVLLQCSSRRGGKLIKTKDLIEKGSATKVLLFHK